MAKQASLPSDQTIVSEHHFIRGLVRDTADIPAGGLYSVTDFLVEKSGVLYKRGGWARQSQALGGTRCVWVGAINVSNRLAAIDGAMNAWDATTPGAATSIGAVGFAPIEHSSQYIDIVILCDQTQASPPKKLSWNGTNLVVGNFGQTGAGA